jgi:hypothetical protein
MGVFVAHLPEHEQYTQCKYEKGEQNQTEYLTYFPSDFPEPPLASFVKGDHLRHRSLPSKPQLEQQTRAAQLRLK